MLSEVLAALASAGGTAVVQAAGTDAWEGFRARLGRLLARGDARRERVVEERLDQAVLALAAADADGVQQVRAEVAASWRTRFEALLEDLDGHEQVLAASELRDILSGLESRSVSAGAQGLAAGGDVSIHAESGSVAGGVIHGGVRLGNPTVPGPPQD